MKFIIGLLFLIWQSPVLSQDLSYPSYTIGNPTFTEIWVDPTNGSDSANGNSRNSPLGGLSQADSYLLWNSFLGKVKIVELSNKGASTLAATITVYSSSEDALSQHSISIPSHGQKDIILNRIEVSVSSEDHPPVMQRTTIKDLISI